MSTPSHNSSFNLSIHISNSILATGTTTGQVMDDSIAQRISAYSHEIGAVGGYLSASMTINEYTDDAGDWLSYGIGRHVEVFDEFQVKIWEGFINQVSINIAGVAISRGPLMNIVNRAKTIYQTVRYDTNPPIGGNQAITAVANNTASQQRYGIFEDVISLSEATEQMAEYVRDTYLQEKKDPETQTQVNIGNSGSEVNVRIDCLGYYRILETYFYEETAPLLDEISINGKLTAIFVAQPNTIFSTLTTNIETNGIQVGAYERGDKRASEIVSSLVAFGDVSQNRYICGVLNDRQIYYKAISTSILYEYKINDNSKRVDLVGGTVNSYWSIQAGQWLTIPDILIGIEELSIYRPLRDDPRNIFIESTQYTAPYNLTLVGGKVSKVPQIFAQLGIGSI